MVFKEPPILICGGYASVCPACEAQGFSVFDGIGDGLYHLTQNGKAIDTYDMFVAYNIVKTHEEMFDIIVDNAIEPKEYLGYNDGYFSHENYVKYVK